MSNGTITKYFEDRGFGFIRTTDGDLFFHVTSASPDLGIPTPGQAVTFDVGSNRRTGRLQAQNVRAAD